MQGCSKDGLVQYSHRQKECAMENLSANLPAPGEIHVWHMTIPDGAPTPSDWQSMLSAGEQDRCNRLKDAQLRIRWIISRRMLRCLIGTCLNQPARSLEFDTAPPHGKPRLKNAGTPLFFNLSHSHDQLLIALACDREVGVDVEVIRPHLNFLSIASYMFSPEECRTLAALPPGQQLPAFFRCWTRWESAGKASGVGLHQRAQLIMPWTDTPVDVIALDQAGRRWKITHPEIQDGVVAAVAAENTAWTCQLFSLPGTALHL
jgi:4'-phosphopantetheinyl transferase